MRLNFTLVLLVFSLLGCKNTEEKTQQIKLGTNTVSTTNNTKQTPLEKSMARGGVLYTDFCMQCHLANGMGIPGNFPPLANSNWLKDKRTESIHAVKFGQKGEIEVNGKSYDGVMVPMGLSDKEVADVMNYVMNNWGNKQDKMVTEAEVAEIKE